MDPCPHPIWVKRHRKELGQSCFKCIPFPKEGPTVMMGKGKHCKGGAGHSPVFLPGGTHVEHGALAWCVRTATSRLWECH